MSPKKNTILCIAILLMMFHISIARALTQYMATPREIPSPLYGITIDCITKLDQIEPALSKLPYKPMARVVFDEFMPPENYAPTINTLYPVSYIMGEILDSSAMKQYSIQSYAQRTKKYLAAFGAKVDLWEIGNEINGEWTGETSVVIKKVTLAYNIIKAQKGKVAITLSYNEGCAKDPEHEMLRWAKNNIPATLKNGLDYVFVSYYPEDCDGAEPDWEIVFARLHKIFPNAKLGFGEIGAKFPAQKTQLLEQFYNMKVHAPNYVGGYFWWYFCEDMLPSGSVLWKKLSQAFLLEHKSLLT